MRLQGFIKFSDAGPGPSATVVGDYINTMKTTFEFNFDLN